MATRQFNQVTYGLTQPLYPEFQPPIIATRNPLTSDKAQLGTTWVNKSANTFFTLTSIVNDQAMWTSAGGGTGISTLTGDVGGAISPSGGNINIVGAATQFVVTGSGSTLTINAGSHVATEYDTDNGSATPIANVINIIGGLSTGGGPNIKTEGSSNEIQIILQDSLFFPDTNSDGSQGVFFFNDARFLHDFGTQNTFLGTNAGNFTLTGSNSVGVGSNSLTNLTSGEGNTAVGNGTLATVTTGSDNVGFGSSLANISTGSNNTAIGSGSLFALLTSASRNTALGFGTGDELDSGNDNILIGYEAGHTLQTNESSNILIGNQGVLNDNNIIRIGTTGSGSGQQNKCFVAGVFGITVGGSGIPVSVDNTGQLGTVVSSERFKENIVELTKENNSLHKLRPVKFNYKTEKNVTNFGFIAEEVAEQLPEILVLDIDNEPMTIRYMDIIALLVKEVQQLRKELNNLHNKIN